ncbi:helix-turn-helix transcriptional regulator [Kitasatospora sp. NBC_01266]|uniref:helix-turn-helix transcriptional regulator n=1 Tax=Kitasatospora sp. NBC_01266 TaxID=2903572 RepID=UPI002E31D31A|nr:LuxR C-terminal-related transcriptional regulator [Kitasatospora sp. NBC_01266]
MESQGQLSCGEPGDGSAPPKCERAIFWRNRTILLFDHIPLPTAFCDPDGVILIANPAMAAEWGLLPGRLTGRNILDLFHPRTTPRLRSLAEAVRLQRRSRYPIEVSWSPGNGNGDGNAGPNTGGGSGAADLERHGEMTVDLVSDGPDAQPNLLLHLRVPATPPPPPPAEPRVSAVEARILALAAAGSTTARIAAATNLSVDGVNYHLGRLSRRWGTTNRAALVARAYVTGVLAPHAWPPAPASTAPGRDQEA